MARGMNHIFLIGAVAREPELRYTKDGLAVFDVVVAGEDSVVGTDGKEHKLPWYHRASTLGSSAERYSEKKLKTGDVVMLHGSLEYSQWETPEGAKNSMVRVKIARMEQVNHKSELVSDASGGVRSSGGMNEVVVIGNLARDPELRYTPTGIATLQLNMGVGESWQDKQGNWQEKTHWIDATLWSELAESMKDLKKGDLVMVKGRLVNESWTDKEGNKRNKTKVNASRVESLVRSGGAATKYSAADAKPAPEAQKSSYNSAPDIEDGLTDFSEEKENMPF